MIRHSIENMTLRDSWRIKKTLYFRIESPMVDINAFKLGALDLLANDFDVLDINQRVSLVEIGPHGYEILIDFVLGTSEYDKQLTACDRILSGLAVIAERHHLIFSQTSD